uniref:Ubiquinol-cytochrome-c reductase cytochrome b n=1 Tax=Leishmania amazonensis TaxID=5659 RepID=Q7M2D5_LEIAM
MVVVLVVVFLFVCKLFVVCVVHDFFLVVLFVQIGILLLFLWDFDLGFVIRSTHISFTSLLFFLPFIYSYIKCIVLIIIEPIVVVVVSLYIYFIDNVYCYVLPCTMMSYWGLTVFSNILATVPVIGTWLCYWIWGSEYINDFTLLKLHVLHVLLPFVLILVIFMHLFCLHYFMSSDGFCDRFAFYCERLCFCCMWFIKRYVFSIFNIILCNIFYFPLIDILFSWRVLGYCGYMKSLGLCGYIKNIW